MTYNGSGLAAPASAVEALVLDLLDGKIDPKNKPTALQTQAAPAADPLYVAS